MSFCPKCQNSVQVEAKFCHWSEEECKRVGLFVDYENFANIQWLCHSGMNVKEKGKILIDYAAHYGNLVCRWICTHPRTLGNWPIAKPDLIQVGFSIRYPDGVKTGGFDRPYRNQADHALIQLINEESQHSQPDIYIIVAGDAGYYRYIEKWINQGHSVRLCASKSGNHLSGKYYRLEKKYRPGLPAKAGKGNFIIDDLDMIFRSRGICPFGKPIKGEDGPAGQAAS